MLSHALANAVPAMVSPYVYSIWYHSWCISGTKVFSCTLPYSLEVTHFMAGQTLLSGKVVYWINEPPDTCFEYISYSYSFNLGRSWSHVCKMKHITRNIVLHINIRSVLGTSIRHIMVFLDYGGVGILPYFIPYRALMLISWGWVLYIYIYIDI